MEWRTARRTLTFERPLVMGILNVTPDSFSDGGKFASVDAAVERSEKMIVEGADLIDIGGESTRPGSSRVSETTETERVIPVIRRIAKRFDIPISVDTTKHKVAAAAVDAGAEIINDVSGLRWDEKISHVAAEKGAGLILMHSRGTFETMHSGPFAEDVFRDVISGLELSLDVTRRSGVKDDQIAMDPGIGFGKTFEQNLFLLAKLDLIASHFENFPLVVGTSRKSFIGKILEGASVDDRIGGSVATAVLAAQNGAKILRVHDVKETVQALKVTTALDG